MVSKGFICWKVIFLVDSTIQHLNNQGLIIIEILPSFSCISPASVNNFWVCYVKTHNINSIHDDSFSTVNSPEWSGRLQILDHISQLEYEISQIIAEICRFSWRLDFPTIFCVVWAIYSFFTNSSMRLYYCQLSITRTF